MRFVLCFSHNPEISKALVNIIVADFHIKIAFQISCDPTVSVAFVLLMDCSDHSDDISPIDISFRRISVLPLVIPGTADAHQSAKIFYIIISG